MSSFTNELLIPLLALLATRLFRSRDVFAWSFTVFLWDLDILYKPLHRALFHNLFVTALLAGLAYGLWRRHVTGTALRRRPMRERWEAFYAVPWAVPLTLMTLFHLSHVIQDLFLGGVTLFWPLLDTYYALDWNVYVNTETYRPSFELEAASGEGVPGVAEEYLFVFTEDVATWLVVLSLGLGVVLWKNYFFAGTLWPDPDLVPAPPAGTRGAAPAAKPRRVRRSRT